LFATDRAGGGTRAPLCARLYDAGNRRLLACSYRDAAKPAALGEAGTSGTRAGPSALPRNRRRVVMSSDDIPNDDLLIRARRNRRLDGEDRRLREVLPSSSETRWLFEGGCAFDREAPVLPGDDARIEGMLRAVERRRSRASAPVPAGRVWLALAAGMLLG